MHLVIVRTGGSVLDIDTYNCQELGLAKALVKDGWDVSLVLAGIKREHRIVEVNDKCVNVYYVTFKSLNQALTSFEDFFPLLEKLKPTHLQIHEFGMWMSYKVVCWAKKKKIPVFLIQGSYQPTQKIFFKQLELLFNNTIGKYILKNVAGIGCKSNMAIEYVSNYSNKQALLTPIGLDVERFDESVEIDWNEKLKLYDKNVLLYVGILEQRRNPLFLLDILSKLPSNYVLVVAGVGPMEEDVRKVVLDKGLQEQCILLGKLRQEQLPSLYKNADLFLLASDYEIYGMVLLEALYFGLPVITTMTAGADIMIENGKNGFILPKDSNIWVDKIIDLMKVQNKIIDYKMYAETHIKSNYIWDKAAENFVRLYKNTSI